MAVAPQRIYFVSLGCPKNQVDTELMLGQVEAAGHSLVDAPEDANVIVVNTCAFIDAAKEESVDTILEMAEFKKSNKAKLVVTGCLAQRYSDDLVKDIPEIDHILGSSDFQSIAKLLGPTRGRKKLPVVQVTSTPEYIYDHEAPRVRIGAHHSAYVKVAEGCDRPCSFCIIPKLRGPQRSAARSPTSLPKSKLLGESGGALELNLIAQDLTRYGWDARAPRRRFARDARAAAASALDKESGGIEWIRLHYTFPSAFDDELIDTIASEPKSVVKYIDVPLQHISRSDAQAHAPGALDRASLASS